MWYRPVTLNVNSFPAFQCSADEGAVIVLPTGATVYSATNLLNFQRLASCHAIDWYKYALNTGRDISSGSLYLVTECTKSANWGTAVFYPHRTEYDKLQFIFEEGFGRWERRGKIEAKTGPRPKEMYVLNDEEGNQCVFLRGYKIMLRADVWDKLRSDADATCPGGVFSSSAMVSCLIAYFYFQAMHAEKLAVSSEKRSEPREVILRRGRSSALCFTVVSSYLNS